MGEGCGSQFPMFIAFQDGYYSHTEEAGQAALLKDTHSRHVVLLLFRRVHELGYGSSDFTDVVLFFERSFQSHQ